MAKPDLRPGRTVTVRVPIAIRKRGGRKLVLAPDGTHPSAAPADRRIDSAVVKAIARAFRWREMLEQGKYATVRELASSERINETYVGRVLRMTLLAPELIEAVLTGKQPTALRLDVLMRPLPVEWKQQRESLVPSRLYNCYNSHRCSSC